MLCVCRNRSHIPTWYVLLAVRCVIKKRGFFVDKYSGSNRGFDSGHCSLLPELKQRLPPSLPQTHRCVTLAHRSGISDKHNRPESPFSFAREDTDGLTLHKYYNHPVVVEWFRMSAPVPATQPHHARTNVYNQRWLERAPPCFNFKFQYGTRTTFCMIWIFCIIEFIFRVSFYFPLSCWWRDGASHRRAMLNGDQRYVDYTIDSFYVMLYTSSLNGIWRREIRVLG